MYFYQIATVNTVSEFNDYRSKMNQKILDADNLVLKRLFNLDTQTYQSGFLDSKTKEMLGLVASLVLRCDDCIKYHLQQSFEQGLKSEELFEILAIGNMVGGSICIPHTRKAVEFWDMLQKNNQPLT